MIGDFTETHLLSVAEGVVQKKTAGTALLDTKKEARIPKFKLKGTTTILPILFHFTLVLRLLSYFFNRFFIIHFNFNFNCSSCKNYLHCLGLKPPSRQIHIKFHLHFLNINIFFSFRAEPGTCFRSRWILCSERGNEDYFIGISRTW
jgi:hypothetical protein